MAVCRKIRRNKTRVCVGDRDSLVTLWDRDLKAPDNNSDSATQKYSDPCPIWAAIATIGGKELFNSSNQLIGVVTHVISAEFILRDISTARTRIAFEGNYYKVLKFKDPEERHAVLVFQCSLLGPKGDEANQ